MRLPLYAYYQLLERYLRPQGRRVVLLATLIFGGIGLQLLSPQIVRAFIDIAQQGGALAALTRNGLAYLAVSLVAQGVRLGAAYLTEDVKWRATNWLRNDLAAHCMGLDMRFHNEHTPGSMIERIDDVESESCPVRSRNMVAMGASSTGLCSIARPGSAMRKALTQRISG